MGNICRSPSGEAVMNSIVNKYGLVNKIKCDSSGTIAHHEGENADQRMQNHASKRGYNLTSIARKIKPSDLAKFDYIIAMDGENYRDLIILDETGEYFDKIKMMTDYCQEMEAYEIPDPYYGGDEGFERVLDLLEDACEGLMMDILENNPNVK